MSVSRVVLPVLDLEQNDDPLNKVVLKGAKQVSIQKVQASSCSADGATFSFQPPSQNTVIDRRIDLVMKVKVLAGQAQSFLPKCQRNGQTQANGNANCGFSTQRINVNSSIQTAPGGAGACALSAGNVVADKQSVVDSPLAVVGNNFAPRQMPLASIIENIDLTINGTHFTSDCSTIVKPLLQYTSPEYRQNVLKESYHHPDTSTGLYGEPYKPDENGSNQIVNPLDIDENKGRAGETPRGTFFLHQISADGKSSNPISQTGTLADMGTHLIFTFVEPLIISPLALDYGKGMTNINNIDVALRFRSNLNLAVSYFNPCVGADGNAMTSLASANGLGENTGANALVCSVDGAGVDRPFLHMRNYTPQDDIRIPNEIVLPYHQPKKFITSVVVVAPVNKNTDIPLTNINNRRLDQIPDALYLWIARQRQNDSVEKSDGVGTINQVEIQFGNQVGILSGHTSDQLLQIAIENGCDIRSRDEAKSRGYVLKLVFGKDIPLADNESAGTRGDYNISVAVAGKFYSSETCGSLDIQEMYVMNGHAIVSPNECRVQTGLLDLKDNIEAENLGHHYSNNDEVSGGSIFSSIGKFFGKIPHYVGSAIHKLPQIIDAGTKIASAVENPNAQSIANAVGSASNVIGGGSMIGGSMIGGSKSGGGYRSRRR